MAKIATNFISSYPSIWHASTDASTITPRTWPCRSTKELCHGVSVGMTWTVAQQKVGDKLFFKHEKSKKFTVLGRLRRAILRSQRDQPAREPQGHQEGILKERTQATWPARCTCPQLSYNVNDAQQKTHEAKVQDLVHLNHIVQCGYDLADQGHKLVYTKEVQRRTSTCGSV